jgi:hypothetical protein
VRRLLEDAYAPWDFPGSDLRPEWVAAGAALLAANPHNTQPWRLVVSPVEIRVHAVPGRNLGAMDSLRREMHLGLGCAVENLVLAAGQFGRRAEVTWLPDGTDSTLVARVSLQPAPMQDNELANAIPVRHTHRGNYRGESVASDVVDTLTALVDHPDVEVTWLRGEDRADFMRETVRATQAIVDDAEMADASHRWYRHTPRDIDEHRDGVTLDASGLEEPMLTLSKMSPPPSLGVEGKFWVDATRGRQSTGSLVGILSTRVRDDRVQQLEAGRAWQRMHLWATSRGLAMQPLNQMAERQDREQQLGLDADFTRVLAHWVGVGRGAQMLFRAGWPVKQALPAPRRPLDWVTR